MRRALRSRAPRSVATLALVLLAAVQALRAQAPPSGSGPVPLTGVDLVRSTYTKYEYQIPMRDGVQLFTAVYVPKDTIADAIRS